MSGGQQAARRPRQVGIAMQINCLCGRACGWVGEGANACRGRDGGG